MAGSGNLKCFQLFRKLRNRVMENEVTYGHHMANSMSIGLLFLAGGKYSINRDKVSVAGLLASFYPLYPSHQNDNRYHLQAFRHLYILATSNRCFEVRDVDTNIPSYLPIIVTLRSPSPSPSPSSPSSISPSLQLVAPFILPYSPFF